MSMSDSPNPFEAMMAEWQSNDFLAPTKTIPALRNALGKGHELLEKTPPPVAERVDLDLEGPGGPIPVRVYLPHGLEGPGPALVFYHGGGFVIGTLNTYDAICQRLAAVSGVRVVSVDYRLAPEHPFPAAVDDALAAFDAIHEGALSQCGVDGAQLAVGGDSAGANLSAVISQHRRGQVRFQLLIYPLMQLVEIKKPNPRWHDVPLVATATLSEISKHYLQGADPKDVRVSPLFAEDLSGLAPAYVMLSELDPLKDEGQAYADRLSAFGVKVETRMHKGVPHGFLNASRFIPSAVPAIEEMGRALARALDVK
ncbi:alpha/beta hydrolase [Maricaulaceae bacterium EIL42A08]|nr:alpha/beta hydrolase [Maricaulaceae bacterium EIL42A08]